MSRMLTIPAYTLQQMRARQVSRTDEGLQASFGISYNTWRRIDAGEPIRASVAERLMARLDAEKRV